MRRPLRGLMLCCAVGSSAAAAAPEPVAGGDRGALLAAPCSGCHRAATAPADGIPSLDGLDADEIAQKLTAYRSGDLRGTLMNRIARGYTEDDIRLLADALGSPSE